MAGGGPVIPLCIFTYFCSISDLYQLIDKMKGSIAIFSKAKAAKLIRALIDQFLNMSNSARKGKEVITGA